LDCWFNAENDYNCYSNEEEKNIRTNLLLEEIEKATNNTELLGEEFISDCPLLFQFKSEYVKNSYGVSSCAFLKIRQTVAEKKNCETKAVTKRKYLSSIATNK
jgi:hypothetical protein